MTLQFLVSLPPIDLTNIFLNRKKPSSSEVIKTKAFLQSCLKRWTTKPDVVSHIYSTTAQEPAMSNENEPHTENDVSLGDE